MLFTRGTHFRIPKKCALYKKYFSPKCMCLIIFNNYFFCLLLLLLLNYNSVNFNTLFLCANVLHLTFQAKPPPLIEALCFPDAGNWPPKLENEEREEQCYSLVITNENGERKFGYCRRVLPEGSDLCLPLIYCIVTSHRADGFFYKVNLFIMTFL